MLFDYTANIELGNMEIGVEIEYDVSRYIPATYMDPPEGGEVEDILSVRILWVEGCDYSLLKRDLGDWLPDLERLAYDYVDQHFCRYELLDAAKQYEVW